MPVVPVVLAASFMTLCAALAVALARAAARGDEAIHGRKEPWEAYFAAASPVPAVETLAEALDLLGGPDVTTAMDAAARTSTTVTAITARSPAGPNGKSGLRMPRASDTVSAHTTSRPPAT